MNETIKYIVNIKTYCEKCVSQATTISVMEKCQCTGTGLKQSPVTQYCITA